MKYNILILLFLLFLICFLLYRSIYIEPFIIKPNIAVYFSGRIKAYENNIENLLNIKNKYNPVFFISLNDEETEYIKEFCKIFNISEYI